MTESENVARLNHVAITMNPTLLDGLLPAMERLAAGDIPAKVMVRPEVSK